MHPNAHPLRADPYVGGIGDDGQHTHPRYRPPHRMRSGHSRGHVLRRRVPSEWENRINAAGMIALLLLMAYVNIMDFVNPAVVDLPR